MPTGSREGTGATEWGGSAPMRAAASPTLLLEVGIQGPHSVDQGCQACVPHVDSL